MDAERAWDSRFVPRLSPIFENVSGGMICYSPSQSKHVNMECLQIRRQRVVYLITYSRADVVKFPSKESSSNAVLQAWQNFGVRVFRWHPKIIAWAEFLQALEGDSLCSPAHLSLS